MEDEFFAEFKEKVWHNQYFSDSQKNYIKQQVEKVDPIIRQKFNEVYGNWSENCFNELRFFSNTDICAKLHGIEELKFLGKPTIPLYIGGLSIGLPLPLALVPYREIQEERLLVSENPTDPYYYDLQAQAIKSVDLWLADHHIT